MAPAAHASNNRVIITHAPFWTHQKEKSKALFIHLRNPKSGEVACYMIFGGILQEIHWFKQSYASWFIGNNVCEDGSIYLASPVDPLIIMLPILEKSRMKRGDDFGKFRSLEDLVDVEGYPGYMHLLPLICSTLDTICEVSKAGASKYYRLDDKKVLGWLLCKAKKITEAIRSVGGSSFTSLTHEEITIYALGMLEEYVPTRPWLQSLCDHYGVELETAKRARTSVATKPLAFTPPEGDAAKEAGVSVAKRGPGKKVPQPGLRKITNFFSCPR